MSKPLPPLHDDDELRSQPLYVPAPRAPQAVGRRGFLQALGGVSVLCLTRSSAAQEGESGRPGRPRGGQDDPARAQLSSWLHLAEDGSITAYTGKVEVGQGIRTTLAQVIAEELRVPYTAVTLVMGDTDQVPFDRGTFGSRTTPDMAPVLRSAAAAARELLLDLAAQKWGVDRAAVKLADGQVSAGEQRASYGELVSGQSLQRVITDAEVTPIEQWETVGRPVTPVSGHAIVTGAHVYPSDMVRPGMLHGAVLRPAAFGATLTSANTAAAEAMEGVRVVRDGEFIGVVAPDEHLAAKAIEAIEAEWETSPQPSEKDLPTLFRPEPAAKLSDPATTGVAEGLAAADETREATYSVPYIAHVPLEPRAAVAEWGPDGRLTVWTGTQRPFGVQQELARLFNLPEERIRVIMPDTGSGYGGKHTGDAALEAARLARAVGAPVKLVWSRPEEFTWAYFRPAGIMDIVAGVRRDGTLTAWEQHTYNAGGAGLRTPYEVAHKKEESHRSESPLRQGSYRGLAGCANFFARESHMDELAAAIEMDPLEFRLHNLTNERIRGVLTAAAERFGWGSKPDRNHGFGIACGTEKGGCVATAAEVEVRSGSGRITLVRAVTAFECGKLLNPDMVSNQVQGMINMAMGGALFEAIRFADGRIRNASMSSYRVPRFADQPVNEVVLLDRPDIASAGAGETPMMALAPAIANAVFAASGKRMRGLPLGR